MEHVMSKTYIITSVSEIIAKEEHITVDEARDKIYLSKLIDLINDDEMGLYGESPLYVYSIYEQYVK